MLCQYKSESTLPQLFRSLSSITASERDKGKGQSNKTGKFEAFLLRHSAVNNGQKVVKVPFTKSVFFRTVQVTHQSQVNFFIMSHDSGILFSKTLKVVQEERCEGFSRDPNMPAEEYF